MAADAPQILETVVEPPAPIAPVETPVHGDDVRYYIVWRVAGNPLYPVGLYYGLYPGVWLRVLLEIPGRQYRTGRANLRRYRSFNDALVGWRLDGPFERIGYPPVFLV